MKLATDINQNLLFNEANQWEYVINNKLKQINTILLCEIEIINVDGSFDVKSLTYQIGHDGVPHEPPIQFNIPKLEIRGGIAGIVVEPIVGDIVVVGYVQRDITAVKKEKKRSNPSSARLFNHNDGIILGIIGRQPPSIFVKITKDGVDITGANKPINIITTGDTTVKGNNVKVEAEILAMIKAPNIKLDGAVEGTSTITAATSVTGGNTTISGSNISTSSGDLNINGSPFKAHTHSGVQSGGSNTGGVV